VIATSAKAELAERRPTRVKVEIKVEGEKMVAMVSWHP
jgi:hypothetical protein